MPIFKEAQEIPSAWSELKYYSFEYVDKGESKSLKWRGPKERYIAVEGIVKIIYSNKENIIEKGKYFDLPAGEDCIITADNEHAGVCRCCGNWGEDLGGTGLFPVMVAENPGNPGDPTEYERNVTFDNHYHDSDEYWIIFQGSGVAYSEGKRFEVGVGDCVATGRGYHHDFPVCHDPVCAVFFETTLVGQKRLGHLWEHTHGKPELDPARK